MTSAPLEYWRPGSEERRLRIFISHRWGRDEALYDKVIYALKQNGFSVQDISLSKSQVLAGPRGGALPKLKIQAEIAARIYTSDVMIAPSRPGVSRSQWVTWEVQLAAVGYGIPILFVNERSQQRHTNLVSQVQEMGLAHRVCEPETHVITRNVAELVSGRPYWAMRREETDATFRYRGPPMAAQNDVLRKLPFLPRLTEPELEPAPPQRSSFWRRFGIGDGHHNRDAG